MTGLERISAVSRDQEREEVAERERRGHAKTNRPTEMQEGTQSQTALTPSQLLFVVRLRGLTFSSANSQYSWVVLAETWWLFPPPLPPTDSVFQDLYAGHTGHKFALLPPQLPSAGITSITHSALKSW